MKNWMRISFAAFLLAGLAAAQAIPGRYVVELAGNPLGAAVRNGGRAALGPQRAQIVAEQARMRPLIAQHRGRVVTSLDSVMNALVVRLPDEEAAAIAALPGVKKVYPVFEYRMDLDHALPIHHVPDAWAVVGGQGNAGAGVKVGVLDTGITPTHPGFADATLKTPSGFPVASSATNLALTTNKIIAARSYEDIYEETVPDSVIDRNGHGTAVAMCAAGETNKGTYATITGVAPKAWIGAYKIVPGNTGSASGDVIAKAMDDALADGMDVLNLSFGSPFEFFPAPDSLPGVAVERLTHFGVLFVTSAGNSGPNLNTMGNFASESSAIAVGAIQNDRYFAGSVSVGGAAPYAARPGTGPNSASPISSTVYDVTAVDPTGFACNPLAAGTAAGKIALILRGVCTFEAKVNNAMAGGAIAVILYTDAARPDALTPSVGAATLPTVLLSYPDGSAVKSKVAANPAVTATIIFNGVAYSEPSNLITSFSSLGPNYDFTIKPDLTAVGSDVYTAAQSVDTGGEIYSADGYALLNGTSFSSPITAGAAAVLKGYRPGLTLDQYRSLLINTTSILFRQTDGWVERVQRTGSGTLNLNNALLATATAYPTSLTFGVGSGVLGGADTGDFNQLTITNVGKVTDTFTVSPIPYDGAPPVQFSVIPDSETTSTTLSLTLAPGQSKTVYVYWTTIQPLPNGEYQGQIFITGKSGAIHVPYWYAVPSVVPNAVFQMNSLPTSATVASTVSLYVRVIDNVGYPITDNASLGFKSAVSAGGGAIALSSTLYYPNIRLVQFRMGATAGTNTFLFAFGNTPTVQVSITGTPRATDAPPEPSISASPRQ